MKPQNIGFTGDGKLKLFDFGLAACVKKKQLASDTYAMSGYTGTPVFMAPEVYLNQPYNEKVDVYSFAMILWEMISGEKAFSGMSREDHKQAVVIGGQRPSLGPVLARAPVEVARLLERCWDGDHMQRPDFATILRELSSYDGDESPPPSSHESTAKGMQDYYDDNDEVEVSASRKRSLLALLRTWKNIFFRRSTVYCLDNGPSQQKGHPIQARGQPTAKAKPIPTLTPTLTMKGLLGSW